MRFFFDVRDDLTATSDTEGMELPSVAKAQTEAIRAAAELGSELFMSNISRLTITVRDDNRALLEVEVRMSKRRLG